MEEGLGGSKNALRGTITTTSGDRPRVVAVHEGLRADRASANSVTGRVEDWMYAHRTGVYPVNLLCCQLGVKRSAYYDWRKRSGKVIPPEELSWRRPMKELFAVSRDSLGGRTMMNNLREEGFEIGRNRTRRLMEALNLKVKQKRQYNVTTE